MKTLTEIQKKAIIKQLHASLIEQDCYKEFNEKIEDSTYILEIKPTIQDDEEWYFDIQFPFGFDEKGNTIYENGVTGVTLSEIDREDVNGECTIIKFDIEQY